MSKTPMQLAFEYCDKAPISWFNRLFISLEEIRIGAFKSGYQAAMNSPEKQDSCEHILDMEKMVDVNSSNNSNGWISVKERLPKEDEKVKILINYFLEGTEVREVTKAAFRNGLWSGEGVHITHPLVSHWMPLPSVEGLRHED